MLKVIQFSIIYLVVSLFLNEVAGKTYPSREIPIPLKEGTTLEIKGKANRSFGSRFEIDFMDEADGDIGFHMKHEFELDDWAGVFVHTFVFNNRENGEWGDEEVHEITDEGFWPSHIRITARNDHFQIDINDYSYTFKYRMPIESIKYFAYGGDFKFKSVVWN